MKQRSLLQISSPPWGHNLLINKNIYLKSCLIFFFFLKVSNALRDRKDQHTVWWLEVLHQAEQNKDFSSELLRKIEEAISGKLNNSRPSRIASRLVMVLNLYITSLLPWIMWLFLSISWTVFRNCLQLYLDMIFHLMNFPVILSSHQYNYCEETPLVNIW